MAYNTAERVENMLCCVRMSLDYRPLDSEPLRSPDPDITEFYKMKPSAKKTP